MPSIFSPEVGGGGGEFEAICVGCAFLLFKSWPLTLSQTDTYEANKGAPLQDCWFVGSQNDGFQLLTDKSGGGRFLGVRGGAVLSDSPNPDPRLILRRSF